MARIRTVNLTMFFPLIVFFTTLYSSVTGSVTNITISQPVTTPAIPVSQAITTTPVPVQSTASLLGSKPLEKSEVDFAQQFYGFLAKKAVIGSTCKNDTDCNKKTNSTCISGKCQCKMDYVPSASNMTCLPKAKKPLDSCTEDPQCDAIYDEPGLAVCLGSNCVCSVNAYFIKGNCYKKKVLGSSCKVDRECSSIPYSYCFQGVCACDPDFSPDETGSHCFPTNATGNITNLDCSQSSSICLVLGTHAYCLNGTCACFPGYHLSSKKCIQQKILDDSCYRDSDCEVDMLPKEPLGARVCIENKCTCKKGYISIIEHNICESGSSIIQHSLLLVAASLLFVLK